MILREETFAKEIFAEFIFGIYDLIRKKLLRKHKTNATSHKKTLGFSEKTHKNWTWFAKICSKKYSVFRLLNRKNKFSKITKCNGLNRVPKGLNEDLNYEFSLDLLAKKYSFPWPRSYIVPLLTSEIQLKSR